MNLTIVIEDKDLKEGVTDYSRLDWLSDRLEFRCQELEEKPQVIKTTEIEDKSFDPADSDAKAASFIGQRKEVSIRCTYWFKYGIIRRS